MTQHDEIQVRPLSAGGRALAGGCGLALVALWSVAFGLEPDSRGFGTHEQMGFAPCTFRQLTGRRCPFCGMTTAFAHLGKGRVWSAAKANVAGCLLGLVSWVALPWCLWSAQRGRLVGIADPVTVLLAVLGPILGLSLILWVAGLAIG